MTAETFNYDEERVPYLGRAPFVKAVFPQQSYSFYKI